MHSNDYFLSLRENHWCDRFDSLVGTYADLLAYAINQQHSYTTSDTADGYELTIKLSNNDHIHYPDGITSEKSFFRQQLVALEQSKEMHDKFHETGRINDSMTDMEKLVVYVQALDRNAARYRDKNMTEFGLLKHDGLFGMLNELDSNCVGTSANIAVFMRLEGMKAQMYSVEGHMIDRILADGRIVLFDYYSDYRYYSSDAEYELLKHGGINYGLGTRLLF